MILTITIYDTMATNIMLFIYANNGILLKMICLKWWFEIKTFLIFLLSLLILNVH